MKKPMEFKKEVNVDPVDVEKQKILDDLHKLEPIIKQSKNATNYNKFISNVFKEVMYLDIAFKSNQLSLSSKDVDLDHSVLKDFEKIKRVLTVSKLLNGVGLLEYKDEFMKAYIRNMFEDKGK